MNNPVSSVAAVHFGIHQVALHVMLSFWRTEVGIAKRGGERIKLNLPTAYLHHMLGNVFCSQNLRFSTDTLLTQPDQR